ncbi:hypothetical protein E2C01_092313 [Portunus trituberculatus]|uniref:Uncharacterized protein n=1 Tax=Portunus trituberculatus TaxID=210409 RepID=A0A5B7JR20_PORTR|nr:hypothetical protein [Portunus trituberculatus]
MSDQCKLSLYAISVLSPRLEALRCVKVLVGHINGSWRYAGERREEKSDQRKK